MWDTRSIIVRFRRQRGNTCLPGEPKSNPKKNKDEVSKAASATNNEKTNTEQTEGKDKNHITSLSNDRLQKETTDVRESTESSNPVKVSESSTAVTSSVTPTKTTEQDSSIIIESESITQDDTTLITEIKEEPIDYDEANEMSMEEDDDDDDEEEIYNQDAEDDEDSDFDDDLSSLKPTPDEDCKKASKDDIPSDVSIVI